MTIKATSINYHRQSRVLDIGFDNGDQFSLSAEYLRVFSPSAEVKGHGPGQEVLQYGKKRVAITDIRQVGNYAIQPSFDDGHDTGIYSWPYLHELGARHSEYWQDYLARLAATGQRRDPDEQVLQL
jgi:DUF971 family protein